jgi:hypothetical protein
VLSPVPLPEVAVAPLETPKPSPTEAPIAPATTPAPADPSAETTEPSAPSASLEAKTSAAL